MKYGENLFNRTRDARATPNTPVTAANSPSATPALVPTPARPAAPAPSDEPVAARPEDVQLVMVSGRMRYGDARLLDASPQPRCELFSMCGVEKRLCVPDTEDAADTLNEDLAAIRTAIQTFYPMPYRLDVCE